MTFLTLLRSLHVDWRDGLEIGVVALVFYRILWLFQGTRALQILAGIVVLVGVYAVASLLKLTMITYLLGLLFTYGAFALLVIFQPEVRAALARLGQARVTRFFRGDAGEPFVDEIADAVERLARSGVGAIIAIERDTPLESFIESGSAMQARLSADLLATIFTPYSPLHDGAVIVRGDSIVAAGCILPLSQGAVGDRSLGTRHRAALGLSEETDAVVIVVSEETAMVSVARNGTLETGLTAMQVRDLLSGRATRSTAEHGVAMASGSASGAVSTVPGSSAS